jgi:hypothetical protein
MTVTATVCSGNSRLPSIELRAATDAEIVSVYGANARHVVGTADGETVAYIGFQRIGADLWGIYHPLASADRSVWTRLFYAFRRELRAHNEPVHVLARDADASRVLRMLGFAPTGDVNLGKDVWVWKPGQ